METLIAKGIHIHAGETAVAIEKVGEDKVCLMTDKGTELIVDKVMFATGRIPNTTDMGLEDVGVALGPFNNEVLVDSYCRTNVDSIFAIGDVTDHMNLTPVALMEGMAVAKTMFGGGGLVKPDYEGVPSAVFSQPPIATCGLTEQEAAKTYGSVD